MGTFGVVGVFAGYGGVDVIRHMTLEVEAGSCVALLGPNGAGKSTLLRTIAGLLKPSAGMRRIDGAEATGWAPNKIARSGLRWVGEPRPLYLGLSIDENLTVGAAAMRARAPENRARVYELLPELHAKRNDRVSSLSGGQQQMLALGQALMSEPKFLCLDEPSIGLAPAIVTRVADLIEALAAEGVGVLWAEQFPEVVLARCDHVMVLAGGELKIDCPRDEMTNSRLEAAYMGMASQVEAGAEEHPSG